MKAQPPSALVTLAQHGGPIVRKEGRKPLQTQPPGVEGGLWKLSEFKLNWYNLGNDGGVIYQQAQQSNTQAFEALVLLTP